MSASKLLARVEPVTFTVIFLWLMAIGPKSLFRDPGALWHVAVGETMLRSGQTIRTDPFSATFQGQPWVPVGWLAECIMALVHRLAGLDSILLLTAATLAALYAWIAGRLAARGMQWPVVMLVLALGIAGSSYHFHPRPHLASMVLMTWMFARLCDVDEGRVPLSRLLWFVPASALWANLHGGIVGGLATFALCGAGWTIAPLLGWPSPITSPNVFVRVAAIGLATVAAVLVNPYGFELPKLWFTLLDSPVLPLLMIEHAPLDLGEPSAWLLVALAALYVAMFAGVAPSRWRVAWLMPLVWFALTCSRIRNGPLFALTAMIGIAAMYPHVRWIHWLTAHGSELLTPRSREEREAYEHGALRAFAAPSILVALVLVLQIAKVPVPVFGYGWARLDPSYWPVELLPELHAFERSRPEGAPVFNEMLFGGFLMYQTPGLRAFIDDRCELHGDERLDEYRRALAGETRLFEKWAARYGFEVALSVSGSGFDRYLRGSPSWELVKESGPASLYRRRS